MGKKRKKDTKQKNVSVRTGGRHTFATDAPIGGHEDDTLNRWPFAERVADTLAAHQDPTSLVVGIYGRWGEGKSTVLRFIQQRLEEEHPTDIVVVRFNPWLFKNDEQLFGGFFEQLGQAVQERLRGRQKAADFLSGCLSAASLVGVPGTGEFSKHVKEFGSTTLDEIKTRLGNALGKADKRVVVLVDDVDRLDRDQIFAVFRLLKVAADFDHTSYVLAIDDEVVGEMLSERYGSHRRSGSEFLEKIVQVALPLPAVPPDVLRDGLFRELDALLERHGVEQSEQIGRQLGYELDTLLMPFVTTLRGQKRYLNAIEFGMPLVVGEVNPWDWLLLEAVRIFRPDLYRVIVTHRRHCVLGYHESQEDAAAALKSDIAAVEERGAFTAEKVLARLFPRSRGAFRDRLSFVDGPHELWTNEKRVCSALFADRFFAYGSSVGDVSDGAIDLIIQEAVADPSAATETIAETLKTARPEIVAQRLEQRIESCAADGDNLTRFLVRVGMEFPPPKGGLSRFFGPRGRVALLTAGMLARSSASAVEIDAVLSDGAMSFGLLVFWHLKPTEDRADETLSEGDWTQLGQRIAQRIASTINGRWLLTESDGREEFDVLVDFAAPGRVAEYLNSIGLDAAKALDLIHYFSEHRVGGRGNRFTKPLREEDFRKLVSLVDVAKIASVLRAKFGDVLPDWATPIHLGTDRDVGFAFLSQINEGE